MNSVIQRNMLLADFSQSKKSFQKWSGEVINAARLNNYNWQKAVVDTVILQTSMPKLFERALQDNVSYNEL